MRIAFLCNSFYPNLGGAELVCKNMVDILSEKHKVFVLTQPAKTRKPNSQYNVIELTAGGAYSYMPEMVSALDELNPDLLVSFGYGKYFSDFGSIYAKNRNLPFIFMPCGDFHTNKNDVKKLLYGKLFGWISFRNADCIITATHWESIHWMKKYKMFYSKKFLHIPYNLPKNFTDYKHSHIKPICSKEYYLYIGRNGPNKKVKELIMGFNALNSKYYLFVAGKDTDCDELKKLKTDNVKFFGTVSDEIKKHFIKNARAVIFPSNYESFGMVLLEADAFNTPYFMSNIPPFKELAPNNQYVFENTPHSIYNLLRSVEHIKSEDLYSPIIKVPNFKKELLSIIEFYENSDVLSKRR